MSREDEFVLQGAVADRVDPSVYFVEPLVDLASLGDARFSGVLTPQSELGATRSGIDDVFLEGAEDYYRDRQGFGYWRMLIEQACARASFTSPRAIVDIGCGFGNATLPLLELFPEAEVIAADLSPNLLAILKRLLVNRDLESRCVAVAMDAHNDCIRPASVDLVVGAAILHHLVDPSRLIANTMRMLRPGGIAIFFEPMEGGQALLRKICADITAQRARRPPGPEVTRAAVRLAERSGAVLGRALAPRDWMAQAKGLAFLEQLGRDLEPQVLRSCQGWSDLNDKWAFPRGYLERAAERAGASVAVEPLHGPDKPFTRHIEQLFAMYGAPGALGLPAWAWDIVRSYDETLFSPEMLREMPIEACLTFKRDNP